MTDVMTQKPKGNQFALLDLSSEDEQEENVPVQEVSVAKPAERHWEIQPPAEAGTIFSRGKKRRGAKKREEDGWTSIVWNKPQFLNDDDEKRIKLERLEESIPMTPPYTDEPVSTGESTHKTSALAKEWAAKIQKDLERAEASVAPTKRKTELTDDFIASLGKLSFFRKPSVVA
jgi:hypothetical protein